MHHGQGQGHPRIMLRVFVILACACCAMAQVPFLGSCPTMDLIQDFNISRYMGKWYEAERYFAVFQFGGKCVTADYSLTENGTVTVYNRQISLIAGISSSIQGTAKPEAKQTEPKLIVTFPSLPFHIDAPYWVLGTDYTSYAVVWSCTDFGVFNVRNAWILTRDQHPTLQVMEKAYQILDKYNIERAFFIRTNQKNC